ncbi:MAG: glutathione-disulfide reductase [Pseudomonadota bacterium]
MAEYDYDLFVIGGGSGGVRCARFSAGYGARVAIAEERYWGGTCVNVGCIPKKLFVYGSQIAEELKDVAGYGWQVGDVRFDWQKLVANKNDEIGRLNGIYDRMLRAAGCDVIDGHAVIVDPHTVKVGDKTYTSRYILVATGGWPFVPEFPGSEHAVTSNELFFLDKLPKKIVIVGGGYISVEFAGIFNGLGVEVTQLYRRNLFLRGFDRDIREFLAEEMRKKGIDLHFNCDITMIEKSGDGFVATLDRGQTVEADLIFYATGRRPLTEGLGLEKVGVKLTDSGAIEVDELFQTSVPSIYALGDVVGRMELTPVALAEGMAVAKCLFAGERQTVHYDLVPTGVFSQPEIGTVGLTEEEARERHVDIEIYNSEFRALKHTMTENHERTLMKLVVDKKTDRVVGAHMVGAHAGDLIQGIAIAMNAGATKAVFDKTIGVHPTSAEEWVTMREPVRGQEEAAE